ncbi:MAG TPA: 4-phosphopantetheinyl transferase [Cytophagales bacterium]|jgi:4'-phosphopantetheinyl transferase|nr:4-phosphopantetheinyl transferase [Cytophagales bacterium]
MPVYKKGKINANSYWCMWEITESLEQLEQNVILSEESKEELSLVHHPTKRKESLASRRCLQEIFKDLGESYYGIVKDEYNKPHLVGHKYHISISHSSPFAVAILHKKLPVGIDIEKPQDKLLKVAPRFLNNWEYEDAGEDINKLCVYWAGKEAIYKLKGKRNLSFREDIRIAPFDLVKRDVIKSEFRAGKKFSKIALNYWEIKGNYIVFCF